MGRKGILPLVRAMFRGGHGAGRRREHFDHVSPQLAGGGPVLCPGVGRACPSGALHLWRATGFLPSRCEVRRSRRGDVRGGLMPLVRSRVDWQTMAPIAEF